MQNTSGDKVVLLTENLRVDIAKYLLLLKNLAGCDVRTANNVDVIYQERLDHEYNTNIEESRQVLS